MGSLTLAATNWTAVGTAAVTGATAIVVGLVGYLSTRLTTSVSKAQIAAENERTHVERVEQKRAERQSVYRELLDTERRFFSALERGQFSDRDKLHTALNSLYEHVNAAVLIGTSDVGEAAVNVHRGLSTMCERVDEMPGSTYGDQVLASFEDTRENRIERRRALIDAMRRDVAPDGGPLDWA